MVQIVKLIFYLLRELIFDNKDEYDFKSSKFNARKFIVLIIVTLSFALNIWMFYRFAIVANNYLECQTKVIEMEAMCKAPPNDPLVLPSFSILKYPDTIEAKKP